MTARRWTLIALIALLWCYAMWLTREVDGDVTVPASLPAPVSAEVQGEGTSALTTPQPRATRTRAASRQRPTPTAAGRLNWLALRICESGNDYTTDTGNGYYGAYQFDLRTWRSVGGQGNPAHASKLEQDRRARLLYADRGAQPWPVCGRRLR